MAKQIGQNLRDSPSLLTLKRHQESTKLTKPKQQNLMNDSPTTEVDTISDSEDFEEI